MNRSDPGFEPESAYLRAIRTAFYENDTFICERQGKLKETKLVLDLSLGKVTQILYDFSLENPIE